MSVSNEYSVPLVTGGCDAAGWPRRRQEILSLFSDHVYGCTPDIEFDRVEDSVLETLELACGTLRESHIILRAGGFSLLAEVCDLPARRPPAGNALCGDDRALRYQPRGGSLGGPRL